MAGAIEWGNRALELAQRLDDTQIIVYALTTVGSAEVRSDPGRGAAMLERAGERAIGSGLGDEAGRAFVNLVWTCLRHRSSTIPGRYVRAELEYCDERGLDYWRLVLLGCRGRI